MAPVSIEEALRIARIICDALAAAHEKGVVHRDLKPANIKVMPDGNLKVLDFGLAKALDEAPANASFSNSPTISMAATNAGIILGTAAYMSPEQARGRAVDRRTDIFAFGCVLYELLTGKPAFDGEDVSEILGRVLTAEPDWSRLPAATPPRIRLLLQRALKKDARKRLSDIRDAWLEIDDAAADKAPSEFLPNPVRRTPSIWIGLFAAALLAAGVFAVPALRHLRESSPAELRLDINTPSTNLPLAFALSPNGRFLLFVASGDGAQRLWLRALDKTDAQPLTDTEGADLPFWSADSHSFAYFASGKLFRMDIGGGAPQSLINVTTGRGGSWNADGTIIFSRGATNPIERISASGGEPTAVTKLDATHPSHRYPQFLPDGRHFLFFNQGSPETQGIYLGSLDGTDQKMLTPADTAGAFLPPDKVVFVRLGALVARHLDHSRWELTGDAQSLADPVGYDLNLGAFSVSADGVIAYRIGGQGLRQLTWFDRTSKQITAAGDPDQNSLNAPELSQDGRHAAVDRTVQGNRDIWLFDLQRGGMSRLTTGISVEGFPVWSPDGTRIAFETNRRGNYDIWIKSSSGAGGEEVLLQTDRNEWPLHWSNNGFLLYYQSNLKTGSDLMALPMTGNEKTPMVIAGTAAEETMGQVSPDGHWVAYQTNESGRFEIVVQAFPRSTGKFPVSINGGTQPRWRPDNRELYFVAPDGKLMAVPFTTTNAVFDPGKPFGLFQTRITNSGASTFRPQYAVSRDGRFLINQTTENASTAPITLLLNWKPKS